MNANELRVDNWITDVYAPEGKMFQIKEIHKIRCIYGNALLVSKYENLKPIPLSPEILEKCGFKFVNKPNQYGWLKDCGNRQLCWCHSDFVSLEFKAGQYDEYNDVLFDVPVKYLHQLQNLYFALCGEELTYNQ